MRLGLFSSAPRLVNLDLDVSSIGYGSSLKMMGLAIRATDSLRAASEVQRPYFLIG